jgi:hypothetical protein
LPLFLFPVSSFPLGLSRGLVATYLYTPNTTVVAMVYNLSKSESISALLKASGSLIIVKLEILSTGSIALLLTRRKRRTTLLLLTLSLQMLASLGGPTIWLKHPSLSSKVLCRNCIRLV